MNRTTLIVGVSGPSASGKTLLANKIMGHIDSKEVNIISEDSYYKDQRSVDFKDRSKINYDHPHAFDHFLFVQHLIQLKSGEKAYVPIYNYSTHTRSNLTRLVDSAYIVVLEGILIFTHYNLRVLVDIRIFIDTPLDICLLRRLTRDVRERKRTIDSVIHQYKKTVRPMYFQFIDPCKKYADIIVPRGGENKIAINLIATQIKQRLIDKDKAEFF